MSLFKTICWHDESLLPGARPKVRMLDQLLLPGEEIYRDYDTTEGVAEAIERMVIRGAPAIGIAAAMGMALAAMDVEGEDVQTIVTAVEQAGARLARTRPTAVNLFWAIERMTRVARVAALALDGAALRERIRAESQAILEEDIAANQAMGRLGAELLPQEGAVLTHCNAGALATGGFGTALGVIRAAVAAGKKISVFADETRPYLQGARLTTWELLRDGIPTTLITDNMAGHLMREGTIDAVVVGADRVAQNGDVANKIGTYSVAVLARENGVPFYVAAPTSTLDADTESGEDIEIEERSAREVTHINGKAIAPEGVAVRHPAFDVTPNVYITAIVTERGVARPPYRRTLRTLLDD